MLFRSALRGCESELAELTGGGQGNLFSSEVAPAWNPASESQAKVALNRWAAGEVHAYFARTTGTARPFSPQDPLTAAVLAEVGGEFVCATAGHHMEAMLAAFGSGAAKTGQIGDGKIFVFGLDHAVRIRTGELDETAI